MSFRNIVAAARMGVAALLLAVATAACVTPEPPEVATIRFESGLALGACIRSTITLSIDGAQVGTMTAGQTQTFTVSPGSHSLRASAREGSWGPRTASVTAGQTFAWTLNC